MNIENYDITCGLNVHQVASAEPNDRMLDYSSNKKLSFLDIVSIKKGLDVISEFFDVNAVVITNGSRICSVALGKTPEEAIMNAIEGNPVDFINGYVMISSEVNSDVVKLIKNTNVIVAPKFTSNALEYLEAHEINYVRIDTPLKEYKKYLSNETIETPLGTLVQAPNLSELNKESFKVLSKVKPTVEQVEDAVFAWKIAKHANSQSVIIAKDLKTSAVTQGLQTSLVEFALNYSCEMAKDGILASDLPLTLHDINAAVQCRISLIILPTASDEIVKVVDKYGLSLITTGVMNILY